MKNKVPITKQRLSEVRRAASLKAVAVRQAKARRDPLTSISIRQSSKAKLLAIADRERTTMTAAFDDIVTRSL
jgi:hypothetical protein